MPPTFLFGAFQLSTAVPMFFLRFILRPHITYSSKYKGQQMVPPGTLIIVNHQSRLDPFFAAYHLGWRNIFRNAPFNFPVMSEYMRNPLFWLPTRSLGCFDIGATPLEKARGLLRIRSLLKSRKTVIIFPEGKIARDTSHPDVFEKGINFLIGDTTPVVLVRLSGMNTWSFWNIKARYQTEVHLSELLPPGMQSHKKFERIKEFFEKK